jgi:AbrB family looped-hinge helix DNA binding protein
MESVSISSKYQVVIPKEIRKQMGLKPGERVIMITFGGRIEIIPSRDLKKMRGILKGIDSAIPREEDRL